MPLPKYRSKHPSTTSQRFKNRSALETTLTQPSKCTLETTFTRTTSLKTKKQMRNGQHFVPSDVNMLLINNKTDPMSLPVLRNRRPCMTRPSKCTLEPNFHLSRQKHQEANAHWMQRNKRPSVPSEKLTSKCTVETNLTTHYVTPPIQCHCLSSATKNHPPRHRG